MDEKGRVEFLAVPKGAVILPPYFAWSGLRLAVARREGPCHSHLDLRVERVSGSLAWRFRRATRHFRFGHLTKTSVVLQRFAVPRDRAYIE